MRSPEHRVRKAPTSVRHAEVATSTLEDLAYGNLLGLTSMFVLFTLRSLVADSLSFLLRRSSATAFR